jgi:hypothetical protein
MPRRHRDPGGKPPRAAGLMPLDYLLQALNDPTASQQRRDWAARAALPYCHSRLADTRGSKKAQQRADAKRAGNGTPARGGGDSAVAGMSGQ